MQNKIPPSTAEPSIAVAEAKGTTTAAAATATGTKTTTTTAAATTFNERQWQRQQLNELAAPQISSNQKTNLTKYRVQKNSRGRTRLRLIIYTIAITVLLQQLQGTMAAKLTNRITATATATATVTATASLLSSTASLTATAAAAAPESSLTPIEHQSRHSKSRLRKRAQLSVKEIYRNEMSRDDIEWAHTCNGVWVEKTTRQMKERVQQQQRLGRHRGKRCLQYKKLLRKMQKGTRPEYREFRKKFAPSAMPTATSTLGEQSTKQMTIDIRRKEMNMWSLHKASYNFLPTPLPNSTHITLRRWHRAMQTFVAAFAYMRRAQLHWDAHHTMQESQTSVELKQLKKSAQRMLCNVELTFNQTNIIHVNNRRTPAGEEEAEGIHVISRAAMEARLVQFKSPIMQLQNSTAAALVDLFDETTMALDIKFLKYKYVQYLAHITKVLRTNMPKLCPKAAKNKGDSGGPTQKLLKVKQKKIQKAQIG